MNETVVNLQSTGKLSPQEKASLIMSKVEILKIKCADGGYTWQCHISEADRNQMLETLKDIDAMLDADRKAT